MEYAVPRYSVNLGRHFQKSLAELEYIIGRAAGQRLDLGIGNSRVGQSSMVFEQVHKIRFHVDTPSLGNLPIIWRRLTQVIIVVYEFFSDVAEIDPPSEPSPGRFLRVLRRRKLETLPDGQFDVS